MPERRDKPFSQGCFEVRWSHRRDPAWVETSQVDAASAEAAIAVVRDGDDGYGEVGQILSVTQRPVKDGVPQ